MGANWSVQPDGDPRLVKAMKTFMLTNGELGSLKENFNGLDKNRTGYIDMDEFFRSIDYKRNTYTDNFIELLGIENDEPVLSFTDYVLVVCSYCLFEVPEILRFCMYIFDQDKQGFISQDDVKSLMNMLHNVNAPDTVTGNIKTSWRLLEFGADNKVEYSDLYDIHKQYPTLFKPAFVLQTSMMDRIMGVGWWDSKKQMLKALKEKADRRIKKKKRQQEQKEERKKRRVIILRMGIMKYYCCPCFRHMYDLEGVYLSADERAERDRQIMLKRRQETLAAKNPQTHAWERYEKKIDPDKGGSKEVVREREILEDRHRADRQTGRADRKNERKRMDHLKQEPMRISL